MKLIKYLAIAFLILLPIIAMSEVITRPEISGIPAPTSTLFSNISSAAGWKTTTTDIRQKDQLKPVLFGNYSTGIKINGTAIISRNPIVFGNSSTLTINESARIVGIGKAPAVGHKVDVKLDADNNFFIDGRTSPRTITLGAGRSEHTAGVAGTRAWNYDIITNGFGDTHATDTDYVASGMSAGQEAHIHDVHIDRSTSTGGTVVGYGIDVTGTTGVSAIGMRAYGGVSPLEHHSGSLTTVSQGWKYNGVTYTDTTTAFGSAGTNVTLFDANNDYIYIGQATTFDDIETVMSVVASGAGVKPTFEYSAGAGSWTVFTPIDGTNGFRQNGNIKWSIVDIPAWTTDTVNAVSSKYWVRIRRTQNTVATVPTESTIKVISSVIYTWDSLGKIRAQNAKFGNISGTTITANHVGGSNNIVTVGGTVDAITLTPRTAITSYAGNIGMTFVFLAAGANTVSPPTINISGLGALNTTMGAVAVPVGGLLSGNYYVAMIESATSIRLSPFDAASSWGDSFVSPVKTETSGTIHFMEFLPTYNQTSGTASNTDIFLNRTQTAVGSGVQKLMDLQVGGVSKFYVDNVPGGATIGSNNNIGKIVLTDAAGVGKISIYDAGYAAIANIQNTGMNFLTNNTIRAGITNTGNFGIGNITPVGMFDVNNKYSVSSNGTTTQSGGAAYAFRTYSSVAALKLTVDNMFIACHANTNITFKLPSASSAGSGRVISVKKTDTAVNTKCFINATTTNSFETTAFTSHSGINLPNKAFKYVSDGSTKWFIFGGY